MSNIETFNEEIRGEELTLEYNKEQHSVKIQSNAIQTDGNIEDNLENIGIYTRVNKVLSTGDNWVTIELKPAVGLELRDESGTLKRRPIGNPVDASVITKQRNSYRFSATAPVGVLQKLGIGEKGSVSLYLSEDNGRLVLHLRTSKNPHSLMARCESGGLIHIPSAVGAAADLDGHSVEWEYTETDDGKEELRGETSVELQHIDTSEENTGQHAISSVSQKTQDIERDGEVWEQEHFQTYIRAEHADKLGWDDGLYVDINFAENGDELVIILRDNIREGYDESTPCVKRLNAYAKSKGDNAGSQLNFYIPNAIVYSMELKKSVRWAATEEVLVGWNSR